MRAVVRAVPVAVLKPMIGVTEALSNVLLGLRNTIDPNKKLQSEDVCTFLILKTKDKVPLT